MTQQEKFEDEREEVYRDESEFAGKIFVFDAVVDADDEEFKDSPDEAVVTVTVVPKPAEPSKYTRRAMIFECNPRMAQTETWYTKKDDSVSI